MEITQVFNATEHHFYNVSRIDTPCKTPYTFLIKYDCGHMETPIKEKGSSVCGFSTKEEAEKARENYIKNPPKNDTFIVMKNGDFTEGKGPMLFDKVFKTIDGAHNYIMSKDGIYGTKQYFDFNYDVNIYGELFHTGFYNGYEIIKTKIIL